MQCDWTFWKTRIFKCRKFTTLSKKIGTAINFTGSLQKKKLQRRMHPVIDQRGPAKLHPPVKVSREPAHPIMLTRQGAISASKPIGTVAVIAPVTTASRLRYQCATSISAATRNGAGATARP